MKVVFSARQLEHAPETFIANGATHANPEAPERALRLLAAATDAGLQPIEPEDAAPELLATVHSERYLGFLQHIYRRWQHIEGAADCAVPNIHPDGRSCGYPKSAVGQLGFHVYDGSCPIAAETWDSALASAGSAAHAARRVLAGDAASYALCRPPGHHAGHDLVGGFCYLNNSALAAVVLREEHTRVAIIDIDVHHGNGTQDIFYARDDVLTVSLHADPARFYPFFWGYAAETGHGAGTGFNHNVPMPRGTGDDNYLHALEAALEHVRDFAPGAVVVALGLDAHEADPFKGFAITTSGFRRVAAALAALRLPTVLVQEGGYLSDHLGANLAAFLDGWR